MVSAVETTLRQVPSSSPRYPGSVSRRKAHQTESDKGASASAEGHANQPPIVFYWLFSAAVTIRVITRRRPVSGTLAWLMVIYVIPLIGAVLYLMIGELNLGRRHAKRTRAMIDPYLHTINHRFGRSEAALPGGPLSQGIHQLLIARNGVSALGYSAMQLLDNPEAIFEQWLRDIEQATDSIRIETYIWHPGGRVDDITKALIAASHRGVKVSLLIDHAGSRRFFRSHWRKKMVAAGIQVVGVTSQVTARTGPAHRPTFAPQVAYF
mgnify:CR=1 FL=1